MEKSYYFSFPPDFLDQFPLIPLVRPAIELKGTEVLRPCDMLASFPVDRDPIPLCTTAPPLVRVGWGTNLCISRNFSGM